MKCCICHSEIDGYGNNPYPYFSEDEQARCCDACDNEFVLAARISQIQGDYDLANELIVMVEALAQEGALDEYHSEKSK